MRATLNEISLNLLKFMKTYGYKLILVIAVFFIGKIIIQIILGFIDRAMSKSKIETVMRRFLRQIAKFVAHLLLIYIIWVILEIPSTLFVAITSIAGIAISLSIQGVLSNFASGLLQLSTKRFKEGDYIKIGAVEGSVEEVDFTSITLKTFDNKIIYIPNSTATTTELINFSSQKNRRIDIEVGVSYESDFDFVKSVIESILKDDKRILKDPAPTVVLAEFDPSAIRISLRCYSKTSDYWNVKFSLNEKIFTGFKKNNIQIPYQKIDVTLCK